jgi:NADP-dependent 3-hydroxy acid dehydrogenase YdfG
MRLLLDTHILLWALDQPPHVDINEILMRPSAQGA